MKQVFKWEQVAARLEKYAGEQKDIANKKGEGACRLNLGQRASLLAIAERIPQNGVIIADEVGMGKTRIAVEVARSVKELGGRVAILVPAGLGYQWHDELREGGIEEAPRILRSLWQYLAAWASEEEPRPWFREQVVVISHAFTNWRLGEKSEPWRWALLPELYARWRKRNSTRLPRGYKDHEKLDDLWVMNAAKSICDEISEDKSQLAWKLINELSERTPWPGALRGGEYGRDQNLRPWLERAVGLGLGYFDLIIIDEAHKSRYADSGLSRLLDQVILPSSFSRRLAMTATPVELDVSQWQQILGRLELNKSLLDSSIKPAITGYAEAVKRVRQCPNSQEAREKYKWMAKDFREALSPFLLRRDKREDSSVIKFVKHTELPTNAYRREREISIETSELPPAWKLAVCATEALSCAVRQTEDSVAKRLRLTLGNGHGIASLLDETRHNKEQDKKQAAYDSAQSNSQFDQYAEEEAPDPKRLSRAQWWRNIMMQTFSDSASLYDHPAILAAVEAIERVTNQGEKVLVFGRFTLPLRALVNLLNAREMLRCLEMGQSWPQAKVHGEKHDNPTDSEWHALRAAHRQLQSEISLDQIDQILAKQYENLENERKKLRRNLIINIEKGFDESAAGQRTHRLFMAFKKAVSEYAGEAEELHPLTMVVKALYDLIGDEGESKAFTRLIDALCDRDEGDSDGDGELDEEEACKLWKYIEERLDEEYNQQQGVFARLMYGGTKPASRRVIQLSFNRIHSFPKVLVAQSMVGREGLNLHTACRTVVLLHPEWNPGVVEQQIGRVDRVGSYWCTALDKAIADGKQIDQLPYIEVCPVIFRGTYDEHNWRVLRDRWDDLRAQLHGDVIPQRYANVMVDEKLVKEINGAAPKFSPNNGMD
ncbi:MAG: DEAD/DEAH box helicase [Nitrospirota bacterium]|nr:DEAD/DEAH box helicase [Nitrospirota bacterium]